MLTLELIQAWTFMRISWMIILSNVKTGTVYALESCSFTISSFMRSGSTLPTDILLVTFIGKMIKTPALVALNHIR